jgi:hypothetical protein
MLPQPWFQAAMSEENGSKGRSTPPIEEDGAIYDREERRPT